VVLWAGPQRSSSGPAAAARVSEDPEDCPLVRHVDQGLLQLMWSFTSSVTVSVTGCCRAAP
jgi:hypothetical protein